MQTDLVISARAVMMGKPMIRGTRITVELILEKLAAGESDAQILEAHPKLTAEAIHAALAFAAQALGQRGLSRERAIRMQILTDESPNPLIVEGLQQDRHTI